ncbi:MAG: T9SS type A sorting domain-containing protein [Muribaculaceae bacterium]|nr:T9SS type A sorting domain-containing protein [Muribaculaceae bacterium]
MEKLTKLLLYLLIISGGYGIFPCRGETFNLKLTDMNGMESIVSVENDLKIQVKDKSLWIFSSADSISIILDDLKEIKYERGFPSKVDNYENDHSVIRIYNNEIVIKRYDTSIMESVNCPIYDLTGRMVYATQCQQTTIIPLISFPKGSYILKIDNHPSVKFIVK